MNSIVVVEIVVEEVGVEIERAESSVWRSVEINSHGLDIIDNHLEIQSFTQVIRVSRNSFRVGAVCVLGNFVLVIGSLVKRTCWNEVWFATPDLSSLNGVLRKAASPATEASLRNKISSSSVVIRPVIKNVLES